MDSEIIMHAGAEGGSVILCGSKMDGNWIFWQEVIDQTPLLLDEPSIHAKSETVHTWEDALALVSRYRWHRFVPVAIHPEFRKAVLQEVLRRHEGPLPVNEWRLDDWRQKCEAA